MPYNLYMGKRHNLSKHPIYKIWLALKDRCLNPRNPAFKWYGGRGITVCDRWKASFPAFLQDMGERPEGFTIERINNNGNYEPANCRWASRKEQQLNLRNVRMITVEGIEYKAAVLAKLAGMKTDTIIARSKTCKTLQELIDPKHRIFWKGLAMSPNNGRTHCRKGHEYTEENTYRTPAGYRQCRKCNYRRQWGYRHP
jgi:hypothetical protein